jgi:hypothetical protein
MTDDFLNEPDELDARGDVQSRCDRDVAELLAAVRRALDSAGPQPPASLELAAFIAQRESQEDVRVATPGRAAPDRGPDTAVAAGGDQAQGDAPPLLVQVAPRDVAPPETARRDRSPASEPGRVTRLLIGAVAAAALIAGLASVGDTTTTVRPVVTPASTPPATEGPADRWPGDGADRDPSSQPTGTGRDEGSRSTRDTAPNTADGSAPSAGPRTRQPNAARADGATEPRREHRPGGTAGPAARPGAGTDGRGDHADEAPPTGDPAHATPETGADPDPDAGDRADESAPDDEGDAGGDVNVDQHSGAAEPPDWSEPPVAVDAEATCQDSDCQPGTTDPTESDD